jgi:hypothetical protein
MVARGFEILLTKYYNSRYLLIIIGTMSVYDLNMCILGGEQL